MKILILCTGNSCRSQMAHGFLQSFDKDIEDQHQKHGQRTGARGINTEPQNA